MPKLIVYTDGGARGNPEPVVATLSLLHEDPRSSSDFALLSDTENFRFPTPSRRT